jgi:hypothetical protein
MMWEITTSKKARNELLVKFWEHVMDKIVLTENPCQL